jgi:hypothetical protein
MNTSRKLEIKTGIDSKDYCEARYDEGKMIYKT